MQGPVHRARRWPAVHARLPENPGAAGSSISGIVASGGQVFFRASHASHGNELWQSDGTAGGTTLVLDINPGASSANPSGLLAVGDRQVYFAAVEPTAGQELWRTDGTSAGTRRVADLYPGTTGSSPNQFVTSSGRLFWAANDGVKGREVWTLVPDAFSKRIGASYQSGASVPQLACGDPILGQTAVLSLTGMPAGTFAFCACSFPGAPVHYGNGLFLFLDLGAMLTSTVLVPDAQGRASLPLVLPNDPMLSGLLLVAQALVVPTPTPPFGVDISNAVQLLVGH